MTAPLRLAFAVHLHQPVGNFDRVFREHLDQVYRPFLAAVAAHGAYPLTLHVSGPLLDWLEGHDPAFLDAIGCGAADGHFELLASGRWEPVLAALPREERTEQIEAMREALATRFGVDARGLWLTERVWEPDLAGDLADAGIEYTLLDDRHLLAAGLPRESLDRPWRTEWGGRALTLLSIDERLRYLIPFRPVDRIESFLRKRHAAGDALLVLGDDGEKFGGWPDTREWVYEHGWLDAFLDMLERLRAEGTLELETTGAAAGMESGGLVYPAPGSYREMEVWSLPRRAALELEALEARLEAHEPPRENSPTRRSDAAREHSPWIRGGQWRGFLARYPEAGRMHAHANRLSELCRERGDPPGARRAIARARCNDAYWHGVFGGIYLPFLRGAVWRELAAAERELRAAEALEAEPLDWDGDGRQEIWVHSPDFSAVVSPHRGGTIEVLLRLADAPAAGVESGSLSGQNDADVLARHLEAYHTAPGEEGDLSPAAPGRAAGPGDSPPESTGPPGPVTGSVTASGPGMASIHERESRTRPIPPAVDSYARGVFQERVYAGPPTIEAIADGSARTLIDFASAPFRVAGVDMGQDGRGITVGLEASLSPSGDRPSEVDRRGTGLTKRLTFARDGTVELELVWDPASLPPDATVVTELSLAHPRTAEPDDTGTLLRYELIPLARSERGFEHILQGEAFVVGWPAAAGCGRVRIAPGL